ncbi:hypothetical protein IKP85_01185 [bacterium]|nr:hypothetical protein [bacterium]
MSEISNVGVNNFGYITRKQPVFQANPAVAYNYKEESDSFEKSDDTKKAATATIVALPVIAAAGYWLTKGKGWSKLKNLLGLGKTKVNDTPHIKTKNDPDAVAEMLERQKKQADAVNNIETSKANGSSRELVERAKRDVPTAESQAAYDEQIAHVAPTAEEAKAIGKVNKEAAEATATAHQVEHSISEEQASTLKGLAKTTGTTIKQTGTFKSKSGYTITYKDGNIQEIVTPDGRKITKAKSIAKYEGQLDLTNLERV